MILGKPFGEELQRDEAMEFGVLGLIDHAHSAAADLFHYAIVRNRCPNHVRVMAFCTTIIGISPDWVNTPCRVRMALPNPRALSKSARRERTYFRTPKKKTCLRSPPKGPRRPRRWSR